jgi:methionyl-tRNA synthetase
MNKKKVLITTAIDYTNDVIHVGQAYEKILADCIARYFRIKKGKENVGFVTGTDEHGTTNEKAAKARNLTPEEHVRDISKKDQEQIDSLDVSYDRFIRTTDPDHTEITTEFYQKSESNGDIYKAYYDGLYCEGCEAYKTLSELDNNGRCPLHPTREIQKIKEENYFFRWSKYSDFLKTLVSSDKFVLPEGKKKEMLAFIENGIKDIPVTRPESKLDWGITSPSPAPDEPKQVIYVWFDALINYYTFGKQNGFWDDETEIVHFVGKDVARWHVLLWPAMLKSAGIRVPDTVYVHGFITLNGEKISKSKGNIIRPSDLVEKYGSDAVRYYFLRYGPITEDVDISLDHFKEVYNSELANGLGNTVARVAKLAEKSGFSFPLKGGYLDKFDDCTKSLDTFRVDLTIQKIWENLSLIDKHITENEPWGIKDAEKLREVLTYDVEEIRKIAKVLEIFMPKVTQKIQGQFNVEKINSEGGLFPRIF